MALFYLNFSFQHVLSIYKMQKVHMHPDPETFYICPLQGETGTKLEGPGAIIPKTYSSCFTELVL